jgi:hypothetical protein
MHVSMSVCTCRYVCSMSMYACTACVRMSECVCSCIHIIYAYVCVCMSYVVCRMSMYYCIVLYVFRHECLTVHIYVCAYYYPSIGAGLAQAV